MGTNIDFLQATDPASGIGGTPFGDVINRPVRQILQALGANPGSTTPFSWDPHLWGPVLNLKTDYGAKGDGSDDYTAIKAALDDASDPTNFQCKTIFTPPGFYGYSKPLHVWGNGVTWIGSGRSPAFNGLGIGTRFQPSYFAGPCIYVGSTAISIPTQAPLVSGSGLSLDLSTNKAGWFNLRDSSTCDLNGLSAFAIECFFKPTGTGTAYYILTSAGKLLSSDAGFSAFQFLVTAAGIPGVVLHTTGGTVTVYSSAAMSVGTIYGIFADYDGSMLRLFLGTPGNTTTLVGSAALTGTIVQAPEEDVIVGAYTLVSPEANFNGAPRIYGLLHSLRVSKVSRHTTTSTVPTSEYPLDGFTLALMNLDNQINDMTAVGNWRGTLWAPYRQLTTSAGINSGIALSLANFDVRGLNSNSVIQLARGAGQNSVYEKLRLQGRSGFYAPAAADGFWWSMRDCFVGGIGGVNGSPHGYGMATYVSGGICHLDTVVIQGFVYDLFAGGSIDGTNVYLMSSSGTTILPLILATGSPFTTWSFNGLKFDTENGASTSFRAAMALSGQGMGHFGAASFQGSGAAPQVIIDGIVGATFSAPSFFNGASTPHVFKIAKSPTTPVHITSPRSMSFVVPLSDVAGAVVLDRLGKLAPVAYSAMPSFDCSLRDEFEITLTGDCAPTITHVTPGQPIKVTVIQDGGGGHAFTWPGNVKGGGVISATGDSVNQQCFTAMLDSATDPTLMADAAMVSA